MHVALPLLTLVPGRLGGSESGVRGLLEAYRSREDAPRLTAVATRQGIARYGDLEGGPLRFRRARLYRSGERPPARLAAMTAARLAGRALTRELPRDADVVHFPLTVPIPATGRPRVVTLFDVQHHDMPQFFSRAERHHRRWAYDASARSASVVVTASEFARCRIAATLAVPPERITVIPSGIDRERFSPTARDGDERIAEELGLPDRFAFYPANLWPHKNHARLLRSLARVPEPMQLLLAGQTYGREPELMAEAARAGVANRVRHLGYVEPDALPVLYRRAGLLIFPSLYEGFGAPPLEAMAAGCPVVASHHPAVAEACAEAAHLFDAEDEAAMAGAWEHVATDAELRERLVAAGHTRVAAFDWDRAAAAHLDVYRRAADRG